MADQTELREALHDVVADVEADDALRARIDRRSRSRRVRPLWLVAAAILAVVAASAVALSIAEDDDKSLPVVTKPSPDGLKPTPTTVVGPDHRCDTTRLAATWVPEAWSPDPTDVPQDEVFVRSWSGPNGALISAWTGILGEPITDTEDFFALQGLRATVGNADGDAVGEIACDVYFRSSGISRDVLRSFMIGLVDSDHGWLWPEITAHQAAIASQKLNGPENSWRLDATQTAVHFAHDVLGWNATTAEPLITASPGMVTVHEAERAARIRVVRDIAGRWWSVDYVWTFGETDYGGSATFNGDEASAGLDFHGDFATSEVRFWRGDRSASVIGTEAGGSVHFDPPWPTDDTGAFLVLLKDADGNVLHAWGTTVPRGDFAAG